MRKCNTCGVENPVYLSVVDEYLCSACTLSLIRMIADEASLTSQDLLAVIIVLANERSKRQAKEKEGG